MAARNSLLKSLGKNDPAYLADGLEPHASKEEIEKAEKILERVVEKAGTTRQQARRGKQRRPPGPKKESSVNPTEEKIRRLKATIRSILGASQDEYPDLRLLHLLLGVFKEFNRMCGAGIFFKKSEHAIIHRANLDAHCKEAAEAVVELKELIADLDDHLAAAKQTTWESFFSSASKSPSISRSSEQAEHYKKLQIELGLMLDTSGHPSSQEIQKEIRKIEGASGANKKPRKTGKVERHLRELKSRLFLLGHFTDVSRPDILRMALAQLHRIRLILKDALYIKMSQMTEYLYEQLREINFHPSDTLAMRPIADLETVFLKAIKRQGKSPFLPTRPEEIKFGPPIIPAEGEIDVNV